MTLSIGDESVFEYQVKDADLASELSLGKDDQFPEVLATSRMVALMELAAARLLRPLLQPGELSVGIAVEIQHLAATPSGETVRSRAEYLGQEGKLYRFRVEVFDAGGLVGKGLHTRAIVATERLVKAAVKRLAKAAPPAGPA